MYTPVLWGLDSQTPPRRDAETRRGTNAILRRRDARRRASALCLSGSRGLRCTRRDSEKREEASVPLSAASVSVPIAGASAAAPPAARTKRLGSPVAVGGSRACRPPDSDGNSPPSQRGGGGTPGGGERLGLGHGIYLTRMWGWRQGRASTRGSYSESRIFRQGRASTRGSYSELRVWRQGQASTRGSYSELRMWRQGRASTPSASGGSRSTATS